MDKIQAIEKLVKRLGQNSVKEYEEHSNSIIEKVLSLLSGCSDNSQVVIAYERSELDEFIQTEFGELGLTDFKSSDEQWEKAWNIIQGYDHAWTYMSDACYEAETQITQEVHQGKEVQDA